MAGMTTMTVAGIREKGKRNGRRNTAMMTMMTGTGEKAKRENITSTTNTTTTARTGDRTTTSACLPGLRIAASPPDWPNRTRFHRDGKRSAAKV